ncbi:TonB-dependent receptor [Zhongshania sp.]|uniref:TonB-dependent receptor n=1 Tax=Zhongshania sp. TaxID=1971902 RepID=UPI003565F0C4
MNAKYISKAMLSLLIISGASNSVGADLPEQGEKKKHRIEEVLVTATKRTESVQDIAGSVSALSGSAIQENNIQSFQDLAAMIPSMVAVDEEKIAIRGIGKNAGSSPVAFHVNGVFLDVRGAPFYDIGAIEVVRGPSGTAFGRNATSGAINIKWRQPESEFSTGGDIRLSGLEEQFFQAYLNIPFLGAGDDRLLGRFAAIKRRGDGTLDDILLPAAEDPGFRDDYFYRMYLTSQITDSLHGSLRAIKYSATPPGGTNTYNIVGSPSLATRLSGEIEMAGAEALPLDITKVRANRDQRLGEPHDEFTRVDGDLTWSIPELPILGRVDVVLIGGEHRSESFGSFDLDGTEEPITEGYNNISVTRRNAELRFASENRDGFDWLFGMFWYRQTELEDLKAYARVFFTPEQFGAPSLPLPVTAPGGNGFYGDMDSGRVGLSRPVKSEAVFLKLDFDIAKLFDGPNIELTAGIRQNHDETDERDQNFYADLIAVNFVPIAPVPLLDTPPSSAPAEFDVTTGELAGRWFYNESDMAYFKVATSYKPGRAQVITNAPSPSENRPIDSEFIDAYEIGWKVDLLDGTMILNLAAFLYDYVDLQVAQIKPGGVIVDNAGAATIKGVDAELQWSPTPEFNMQASLGWLDARYDEFCGKDAAEGDVETAPACNDDNPQDFSGDRLPSAPEYTAALTARYTFNLDEFGSLTPQFTTNYSASQNRRGRGNPLDEVDAYTNSSARLIWESSGLRWKVTAFVENIENNNDIFFAAQAPMIVNRPGTISLLSNLPPRIYGTSVEVNF